MGNKSIAKNKNLKMNKWYLITIQTKQEVDGMAILAIIQLLRAVLKCNFVVLNDVEGAPVTGKGSILSELRAQEGCLLNLADVLKTLSYVKQLDWADFFLFEEKPLVLPAISQGMYYPPVIEKTDATIRTIDGGYIYIYTPYEQIVSLLSKHYEIESIATDFLKNLSYPL